MEESGTTSVEDAKLAVEIFKKALEYRSFIQPAVVGEAYRALTKEERLAESMTPRLGLSFVDEEKTIPVLFFRFVGESPIIEALFYPYEAILSFLAEARDFALLVFPSETDDAKRADFAFERAVDMTLMMLDYFYQRAELMMDSFVWEVITIWRLQNRQRAIHYRAELGEVVEKFKDRSLENLLTQYSKQILGLWKWQGQSVENVRKLQLAEDYDRIYLHWKRLLGMIAHDDWREYAKAGKFSDTPDDLLDKLRDIDRRDENTTRERLSELALEHAARRAGIIKKHGVHERVLSQRKEGIKATGYSSAHLFDLLKEGRELAERLKQREALLTQDRENQALDQTPDPARMENVKSLEQKINLIRTDGNKTADPISDSAQE